MFFANGTSNSSLSMFRPTGVQQNVYTTIYEVVLPAACETSSWMATYTVTETCRGNPANYVAPTIPPGFVVTTVNCAVCAQTEMAITCPGAQPTGMGKPTVHIEGNGVTATMMAYQPTAMATMHTAMTGPSTAAPTHAPVSPMNPGNMNSGNNYIGNTPGNNITMGTTPKPYTGEAAVTLKRSLMVGVGLAFMAPLLLV